MAVIFQIHFYIQGMQEVALPFVKAIDRTGTVEVKFDNN